MCPRRASLGLLLASLALPGCEGESVPEDAGDEVALAGSGEGSGERGRSVGAAASAIVGGAEDGAHPAVVALTVQGQAFCSGALIAPTVVLTAAHCLHEDFVGALPLSEVRVFFGADVAGAGTFIEVKDAQLHPAFAGDVPGRQEDDVALVHLLVEAPVAPLPLGEAPERGEDLALVGFGRAAAEVPGTGVKRSGSSRVMQVTPRLLVMKPQPATTCLGDSGGPALARIDGVDVVVGLHTRSDCRSGMIEERIDAHLDGFLRGVARAAIADVGAPRGDVSEPDASREEHVDDGLLPTQGGCSVAGVKSSPSTAFAAAALAALSVLRRRKDHPRRGDRR